MRDTCIIGNTSGIDVEKADELRTNILRISARGDGRTTDGMRQEVGIKEATYNNLQYIKKKTLFEK